MDVSEQLRRTIIESGQTHYRIWKESGVSSRIIDRFVGGTADVRASTIDRLCSYFGLELCPKKPESTVKQAPKKAAAKRKQAKKKAGN